MAQNNKDWFSTGCAVRIPLALLAVLLSPILISVSFGKRFVQNRLVLQS
jgi:hypothetical protein